MSFTLNIFDQRRTGIKLPYCLPQKHYIDGAGHDYVDPFQFNENNPAPAFIETDPEYGQLIESLVAKRSAALKLLTLGQPCGAELEALHAVLSETRVVAEEKSPPDFIDPSLPNFEQDLLQDERDRHVIFEQSLNFERVKLLYNAGLHAAREANKLRFGDNPQCKEKFEKAAGIFNYLSNCSLPLEEVPNEVSPEFLRILALCCLCGAAENEMTCRQVSAPTQWEGLTHLCFNMSFFFGKACSLCKRAKQQMTKAAGVACLANVENFTAVKYEFYKGLAHDYYSLQPQTRRVGGRLRKALRSYEHALVQLGKTMQGLRTNVEKEIDHLIGSVRVKLSQVQEIRSVIADVSPADAVEPEAGAVDLIHAFDECELLRLPPYYKACSADSILRSSRYEGATQSPGQKPTVPEWVHQFEEPGDGGEAHVEDHAQEEEPPPLPETTAEVVQKALQLELVVAQQDLFHKPLETRLDAEGNPLVSYHELDMVAKVTCADLKRVERAEGFATIMLFDTWAKVEEEQTKQQQSKIASVSEIAKLLLRVVGLTERDRVCVVGYVNGKLKVFPLTACDALGIESVARQISSLSPVGNHRGSKGSSIIKGLVEAMKSLQKQNEKSLSSYEVVVFSDGVDSTADTHYYNWTKLHSLYDAHATAEKVLGRVVRVHTFALGSSSDTYLLKAVAKRLGGDHSVAEMTHDGLSAMRMWLLRKIADQQSKVASSCKISVRCSQDVTMKQIGTYDLVFDPTFVHPHARDPCEGEMSLQDFSQGHSCHVVITLAIPESRVQFDPTQLAEVFVTYTDAVSGSQETLVQDIVIGPTEQVITREGFSWLPQLYCARVAGTVQLSGIGGGTTTLSSGDLVDPVDCIETKAGRMTAQLSDGTHFTFLERTSALLNSIDSGDRASCFTLRKGAIFISTGMGAECDVRILEPMYTVTVESHSFVKVGIEPKSGLITVNCMYGHAFITTERNDERSVVEVLSLRQTQMSDALSPITPWTLEEASYAEWLSPGIAADSFLSTLLEIGIQVCRTVCSEWLAKGALWLRKGSWERVTESKANRRCREFLIRFWLRESKHFLTNNMSGLSPETEHIRKVVDRGVQLGFSTDKSLRSDRRALFDLYRSAVSLRDERSAGSCDKYDTQLQRDLQAECADAKDKAERDREEAEASRQRQLRNHEASRRERILRTLFPLSDLDGVGVVYATTMEQAILTLSEVVDPVLTELVSNVCARWAKVLRAVTKNKRNREVATCAPGADHDVAGGLTLNEEDFVKMWISLTGECDTPWFNLFMEQLHGIVEELCILNEGSRRSRAVFSLFRKWDSEGNGVIRYSDLLATFEAAHGHDATYHSDLDRLKCGLHAPPPAAVKAQSEGGPTKELVSFREKEKDSATVVSTENSEPTTVGVVHSTQPTNPEEALTLALGVPPPEHISADHKVTLRKLHYALAAFYGRYTERAYHQAVEKLAQIVGSKRRSHNTIIRCVKSIQRSQEMEHLQQWDLRHVFDGISGKKLSKLIKLTPDETPAYAQTAAAPVCILCGLVVNKRVLCASQDEVSEDYWAVLSAKLLKDADGFVDFLRNFPVMSVTYRQVLRALKFLDCPDYDSCRLMSLCPPVAHLCEWVKVILKVIFLEHGWDFSNHMKVLHKKSLHTDDGEAPMATQRLVEKPGLLADYSVVDKPHVQMKFNKTFEGIIEADDPTKRACSRFSMYSDLSDVLEARMTPTLYKASPIPFEERVTLPDRRLNTPLLRTMPVASVTSCDGLPPHFIPRVDYDARPDAVCTPLQQSAYMQGKAGRTWGADAGNLTDKFSPHPPRPQSAPVGRKAPRGGGAARGFCSTSPSSPPCSATVEATEVGRFLESNGLQELNDQLLTQGYDDLEDLRSLLEDEASVSETIPKRGHRMKLRRLLAT